MAQVKYILQLVRINEMSTKIFKTFSEFTDRPDKSVNGVSPTFAKEHPYYESDNKGNVGCWECIDCWGCVECIDCERCNESVRLTWCTGCYESVGLTSCHDCVALMHKTGYRRNLEVSK